MLVFALSGFAAIGNEIIWTRFLTLIIENNVYTYTLTLTVILLGIVIGSLWASMFTNDLRKSIFRFGALQIVTGIVTFAIIMAPAEIVWISFMENIGEDLRATNLRSPTVAPISRRPPRLL